MAWTIDPSHSLVEFSVSHLMISTVKGRFSELSGEVHIDAKRPQNSWVKAQVQTASIQTGVAQRDAHLRSADFFETFKYPTITFESTQINLVDQYRCILNGNLTIHGVTKQVPFQTIYTGRNRDPLTNAWRIGMFATTTIDRREFDMKFNQANEGIIIVGYKIRIEINVEAILMS